MHCRFPTLEQAASTQTLSTGWQLDGQAVGWNGMHLYCQRALLIRDLNHNTLHPSMGCNLAHKPTAPNPVMAQQFSATAPASRVPVSLSRSQTPVSALKPGLYAVRSSLNSSFTLSSRHACTADDVCRLLLSRRSAASVCCQVHMWARLRPAAPGRRGRHTVSPPPPAHPPSCTAGAGPCNYPANYYSNKRWCCGASLMLAAALNACMHAPRCAHTRTACTSLTEPPLVCSKIILRLVHACTPGTGADPTPCLAP
jgi:hypothetical protein